MTGTNYSQYILILDPNDEDDTKLINFIEGKKGKKRKNSYSAILKLALEEYMRKENDNIEA
jgi:hypothetical protein